VLDGFDGDELILGLDIREAGFELVLPGCVGAEGVTLHDLALRVQLQQVIRDLRDRALGPRLDLLPFGRAQPVQLGHDLSRADVAREPVGLVDGHVELVALRILDLQVLPVDAIHGHLDEALELADAVLHVDDEIARLHVREEDLRRERAGALRPAGLRLPPAE